MLLYIKFALLSFTRDGFGGKIILKSYPYKNFDILRINIPQNKLIVILSNKRLLSDTT